MKSNLVVVFAIFLTLSSCGTSPLSLLTGGGTNVAANTQVGKTNSQTVGTTTNVAPSASVKATTASLDQSNTTNKTSIEKADKVTVNENSAWLILFALIGWILPSPNEIGRWFKSLFTKRPK
jgi:hypothetical protein